MARQVDPSAGTPPGIDAGFGVDAGRSPESYVEALLERLREHASGRTRYHVLQRIAQGGMGVVHEVWDEDLRRRLAMKSLRRRADSSASESDVEASEERFLTRFLEEAQITGQLAHPSVVPLHELGLDAAGRPYFTMPLVRGSTFAEIVDGYHAGDEDWGLVRLLGVLLRVCEAVGFAHEKEVIHRDLKPANVMVGRFGEVYVMDWGLARVLGHEDAHDLRLRPIGGGDGDDELDSLEPTASVVRTDRSDAQQADGDSPLLTMDGDVIGTPAYMAPEQAMGAVDALGPRSDVYALGCMLYFVITGRDPYSPAEGRVSARSVLALLLMGPPARVLALSPSAPQDLVAICEKAMARNPDERYASALELARDLIAFLELRPVGAASTGAWRTLKLWAARNRTVARVVSVAAGLILALTVFFVARLAGAYDDERVAREESVARGDVLGAGALIAMEANDELWPPTPERAPTMAAWIGEAREILGRSGSARSAALRPSSGTEPGALAAGVAADLDGLRTLLPQVEERLARARDLRRRTIEEPADEWRAAIADVARDAAYGGLALEPQLGLVPLRRDPTSGLWEFWHVLSGERPELLEGLWDVREETGIVLVLLPAATFEMGLPGATDWKAPYEANVESFFLAKYEVTQAQWRRALGSNPAHWRPGMRSAEIALDHPVEWITWHDARRFAHRQDLVLPTEVQWEYAARGGTRSLFWTGDDVATLEGRENFNDPTNIMGASLPKVAWTDGFYAHAPVGSFLANPFGLHDMLGNVSEWMRDTYWNYPSDTTSRPVREDDPRLRQRVFRGGSWYTHPSMADCATRRFDHAGAIFYGRGVRMARAIDN